MPNAMRPSAPRPQAFNTIRAATTTNTQVPRMMASQRMRTYPNTGVSCGFHCFVAADVFKRVFPLLSSATQALSQRPAGASATAAPVRAMPQYKYAAGVRNPQQHMASQPQVPMQQVRTSSLLTVKFVKQSLLTFSFEPQFSFWIHTISELLQNAVSTLYPCFY